MLRAFEQVLIDVRLPGRVELAQENGECSLYNTAPEPPHHQAAAGLPRALTPVKVCDPERYGARPRAPAPTETWRHPKH